jgi:hypothetical protein
VVDKLSAPLAGFGIDTVGVSFQVDDFDTTGCTYSVQNYGRKEDERYIFRRKLDGGGFMQHGVGNWVWLEASLPKRVGHWRALSWEESRHAFGDLVEEAERWCHRPPAHRLADPLADPFKLIRLDVVRDFSGITQAGSLMNGLAAIRHKGNAKVQRFRDGDLNGAETLRIGPRGPWACTLYDKHAETDGAAPPGTLRYEARLRKSFLRSRTCEKALGFNPETWGDVDGYVVERLARERWKQVGFDHRIMGLEQFAELLQTADLSDHDYNMLQGYLLSRAAGLEFRVSPNTERKYRKLAESLGISLDPGALRMKFTVQLDIDLATQQLTVDPEG